jgi:hypothetical protein
MMGLATLATMAVMASTVRGYVVEQTLVTRTPVAQSKIVDGKVIPGKDSVDRTKMTVYIARDKARIERENDEVMIILLRKGEILKIDDVLECYDRKLFRKLRKQQKMQNALMLEQIAGTPIGHPRRAELIEKLHDSPEKWQEIWKLPEGDVRAALIKKYGLPDMPPNIKVQRTKQKKEIAGIDCQRWESTEDGEVADWAYLATRIKFDPRYYEFMELMGWIGPDLASALRRAKRLPLESVMHLRDGSTVTIKTQSVTERDLDTSLFEVPEDYNERKSRAGIR